MALEQTNEFDTDINYTYLDSKQNTTTDLVSTISGGVTATVVDAGVGLWNSLPMTEEVETRDILKRVNNDALRVYDENPELIQAASFIGSSFVPGGLALKGMKLARAGVKGMDWFSTAGRQAEIANIGKMFAEGAGATKDYRNAVRSLYAKTAVNQTIDAIAAEAAIVGMLHNTPLMEDYLKDPVENFGISIALGGVLGTGIGLAADHFLIRGAAGQLTETALDSLRGRIGNVPSNATNAVALQVTGKNLDNLSNLLEQGKLAGKTPENDLLMSMAQKTQGIYSKEVEEVFVKSVDDKLLSQLDARQREELKTWMINSPELVGVESISPATGAEFFASKLLTEPKTALTKEPELLKTSSKKGPTVPELKEAIYFPELGLYGSKSDIKHYAGASALYQTADDAAKPLKKNFGKFPDHDTLLSLQTKSAAQAQGEYIGAMQLVNKMSLEELKKLIISPTDNAMLTAVRARMAKDPEFAAIGVRMEDATAYSNAVIKEKLPQPDNYSFANSENMGKYSLLGRWTNPMKEAEPSIAMLRNWRSGSVHSMRLGAEEYKRAGFSATNRRTGEKEGLYQAFKGIYESPESIALREEFSKVADAEGYIYLWRGSRSLKDRTGVRSYTTLKDKAEEFGSPRLYKVHAEDIVAGILDPGHAGPKTEILVMEGERLPAQLSDAGKATLSSAITPNAVMADITNINQLINANKQTEIDSLIANGIPPQSIAIKTNTPVDVVERYSLTRDWLASQEAPSLETIKTIEDFDKVLSPLKTPLQLKGNLLKNSYATAMANNNNKMMKDINAELTAATMYKSKNPFVAELADFLYRPSSEGGNRHMLDLIYDRLGKANNQAAGNFFTGSADFAMRNMGDLGPAISFVGKEIQHIGNKAKNSVIEPIRMAMLAISNKPVETLEFNTFREVNAGLAGWRTFKDGKIWQRAVDDAGKPLLNEDGSAALKAVKFQGKDYQVVSKSVIDTIETMQANSKQLLDMTNTTRRIQGLPDVNDIGLWVPSFNPLNKHIAYVHDLTTDSTSIIWANSKEEQQQLIRNYRINLTAQGKDSTVKVYEKGIDQENWSRMNSRLDVMKMTVADSSMKKSGSSASSLVRTDNQVFAEITSGYEHYITSQFRNMADLAMSDITHELDTMSKLNRFGYESQPFTGVKKVTDRPKDAAAAVKNLLLGDSNLGEYTGWKDVNQSFETGLSMGVSAVSTLWKAAIAPLERGFFGGKKQLTADSMSKMDYEKFSKDLEKAGVVNPFAAFDAEAAKMFNLSSLTDSADTSKRLVFASNALAATLALKVGELAQPLVNIMSLPILTGLASANRFPDSFMGISKGTAKVNPVQVMYEGQRAMHDPQFAHWGKLWEEKGYFNPMVSEVNDTLKASRSFNKGAIQATERMVDSKFVEIMSKPADWSEAFVRRTTMYTGGMLAKRLYPELDDLGVTIFARDFMDKAVGNFHAAQRPVFFQGTLGVALGLFQTYSLTLGQNIYRHLELKNYKALGTAMLTQSSLFGIGSMPGFQAVSNMIGEHFSDQHVDLTTGTYRALGDDVAKTVLYGLPSLAGIGTHTRGDANFRIPGLTGDNVVAINFAKQAAQAVGTVANSLGQGDNAGQAFMEALSLQSLTRPLARGAELAMGHSITRAGNTVQTPEEVWTATGIMARVLGTRPVTEIKLREADHLNRFYGAIDREARQELIKEIRTSLRNSNFDESKMSEYAEKYFRSGGTPTGWRNAVNTALAKTETSGKEIFIEKLKPNSPFQFMIDNQDGE